MTTDSDPDLEPTLTNPDEIIDGALPRGPVRLPDRLRPRFEVLELLPQRGAEAVLMRARERESGAVYVLKLYGESLGARSDVLARVKGQAYDHVATLHDYGTVDGCGYEILEWIAHGTLDDYLAAHGDRLGSADAEVVLRELLDAIVAVHRLAPNGLAHGDIKPANVMVRSIEPLDLVLCDFGRATIRHDRVNVLPTTLRWSPPEDRVTTPEGDYWSLGCLMFRVLTGEAPYADLDDAALVKVRSSRRFPIVPDSLPDDRDWLLLLRGLLTRDPHGRWGQDQVTAWLEGGRPAFDAEWDDKTPVVIEVAPPVAPISFAGTAYSSLPALAAGMAAQWDSACRMLAEPSAARVFEESVVDHAGDAHDVDLAADVAAILDAGQPTERTLAILVTRLDPTLPPAFRGFGLAGDGVARLAGAAAHDAQGREAQAVEGLAASHALAGFAGAPGADGFPDLDRRWAAEFEAWEVELRAQDVDPTAEQRQVARARILAALSDPGAAERLRAESRRREGDARHVAWFVDLSRRAGSSIGRQLAVTMLAATAEEAGRQARALERAQAEESARLRFRASVVRAPRTRRLLGWSLVPLLLLGVGSIVVAVAPALSVPVGSPAAWVRWWSSLPGWVAGWLAVVTSPLVVLPLLSAGLLLWLRAPRSSDRGTARHPMERRAGQVVIAATGVLLPPVLPLVLLGWVRGLREYTPDALYPRQALRTMALLVGSVATIGTVLMVWGVPLLWPYPRRLGAWPWDSVLATSLPTPLVAPWWMTSGWLGLDPGRDLLPVSLVLAACGLGLLVAGGLAYTRSTTAGHFAMGLLLLPGTVMALNVLLVYGMVGRSPWLDAAWIVLTVLLLRYRIRHRPRPREHHVEEEDG